MNENKAQNSAILVRGVMGGVIATVLNLTILLISKTASISFEIPGMKDGDTPVDLNFTAILISSLAPAIAAILIVLGLNRFTKKPFRIFLIIALVVLILSFFPVISINVAEITKVILGIMHVIAAAAIVGFLKTAFNKQS